MKRKTLRNDLFKLLILALIVLAGYFVMTTDFKTRKQKEITYLLRDDKSFLGDGEEKKGDVPEIDNEVARIFEVRENSIEMMYLQYSKKEEAVQMMGRTKATRIGLYDTKEMVFNEVLVVDDSFNIERFKIGKDDCVLLEKKEKDDNSAEYNIIYVENGIKHVLNKESISSPNNVSDFVEYNDSFYFINSENVNGNLSVSLYTIVDKELLVLEEIDASNMQFDGDLSKSFLRVNGDTLVFVLQNDDLSDTASTIVVYEINTNKMNTYIINKAITSMVYDEKLDMLLYTCEEKNAEQYSRNLKTYRYDKGSKDSVQIESIRSLGDVQIADSKIVFFNDDRGQLVSYDLKENNLKFENLNYPTGHGTRLYFDGKVMKMVIPLGIRFERVEKLSIYTSPVE